jgi:hypothetical protein
MGRSGRALVEARYSRQAQARLLESLLRAEVDGQQEAADQP